MVASEYVVSYKANLKEKEKQEVVVAYSPEHARLKIQFGEQITKNNIVFTGVKKI